LRSGQIETQHRTDALAAFTTMSAETFTLLPISGAQFRTAARFADQHALGLRAGDALHLAICADHGATLCTLDRRLGEAGPPLGVKAALM
jgi:predicted nucleic acid-binding protein